MNELKRKIKPFLVKSNAVILATNKDINKLKETLTEEITKENPDNRTIKETEEYIELQKFSIGYNKIIFDFGRSILMPCNTSSFNNKLESNRKKINERIEATLFMLNNIKEKVQKEKIKFEEVDSFLSSELSKISIAFKEKVLKEVLFDLREIEDILNLKIKSKTN